MRILFLQLFILLNSVAASAQTIVKIEGNKVTATISDSQSLKEGQEVNFLDADLNPAAKGTVKKLSPQGRTAIIEVTSGTAQSTHTIEKAPVKGETPVQVSDSKTHQLPLTDEDRKILTRGEIGTTAYVLGGVLGTYPLGFGIGHAIQGRYSEKGWIFTVGEVGSLLLVLNGATDCTWNGGRRCDSGTMALGFAAFIGFRIWEIVDLWAAPPEHNRKYRALKARQGFSRLKPIIAPTNDGGALLGMQLKF